MSKPKGFAGKHRLEPLSFPLHEALGLALLFQNSTPELVQSLQMDGTYYGFSAAQGYLRLRAAVAELFGDTEGLDIIAVERAELDQVEQSWASA